MGQIVKKPKKGRPSKSDLAARQLRRSNRRRNIKHTIDFDDYLDDDEYSFVENEEDERLRAKKIKLLLKLHSATSPPTRKRGRPSLDSYSSEEEEDCENNKDNCEIEYGEINEEEEDEVKGEKRQEGTSEVVDCAPGSECLSKCPLPDKKVLELILHKLQKKDVYGVFAEPVDPEELPDYHDLIENPMDFSTIRSRLSNGSYSTLEQFESDVFLLCSNAMQYNEPDTRYHKQARSIQDLAKRKFQKLRIDNERLENQMKSEPMQKPVPVFKKQTQRLASHTLQEPIGSNDIQAGGIEKASSLDLLVEGNCFMIDTSVDKLEESLAGRDLFPRYGRKAPPQDENHVTYSIGSQPNGSSDSTFSPFDGETKQLIPVGLYIEHAYARSLSRFAGSLGSVAWRVASKRIEQILPPGIKFGRGWVGEYEPLPTPGRGWLGEYEPLPTPVLIPENYNIESDFLSKPQHTDDPSKHEMFTTPELSGSSISRFLDLSSQMSNLVKFSNKVVEPVELIGPSSANHNPDQLDMGRWVFCNAEAPMPKSAEMVSVGRSPLPLTYLNQSNISGLAVGSPLTNKPLLNGRTISCVAIGSKEPPLCSEMNKVGPHISHGQGLALNDPVQLMKMLTEKNNNQQYTANQFAFSSPPVPSAAQSLNEEDSRIAAAGVTRSWMSMGSRDLRSTADNIGLQKNQIPADSLYNATLAHQDEYPAPVAYFQSGRNNYPFHGAFQQPARADGLVHFQNQQMAVPQLSPVDLSRLQAQSPWRNVSPPTQQVQKLGTCPPDLNVRFQSVAPHGGPSPGVLFDPRHPDLALQL